MARRQGQRVRRRRGRGRDEHPGVARPRRLRDLLAERHQHALHHVLRARVHQLQSGRRGGGRKILPLRHPGSRGRTQLHRHPRDAGGRRARLLRHHLPHRRLRLRPHRPPQLQRGARRQHRRQHRPPRREPLAPRRQLLHRRGAERLRQELLLPQQRPHRAGHRLLQDGDARPPRPPVRQVAPRMERHEAGDGGRLDGRLARDHPRRARQRRHEMHRLDSLVRRPRGTREVRLHEGMASRLDGQPRLHRPQEPRHAREVPRHPHRGPRRLRVPALGRDPALPRPARAEAGHLHAEHGPRRRPRTQRAQVRDAGPGAAAPAAYPQLDRRQQQDVEQRRQLDGLRRPDERTSQERRHDLPQRRHRHEERHPRLHALHGEAWRLPDARLGQPSRHLPRRLLRHPQRWLPALRRAGQAGRHEHHLLLQQHLRGARQDFQLGRRGLRHRQDRLRPRRHQRQLRLFPGGLRRIQVHHHQGRPVDLRHQRRHAQDAPAAARPDGDVRRREHLARHLPALRVHQLLPPRDV